jgi:hypothetical protein
LASIKPATGISVSDNQESWLVSHIYGISLCSFWSLHRFGIKFAEVRPNTSPDATKTPPRHSYPVRKSTPKHTNGPLFLPSHLRPSANLSPSYLPAESSYPNRPRHLGSHSHSSQGVRLRGHALCSTDNDLHRADAKPRPLRPNPRRQYFAIGPTAVAVPQLR